MSIYICPLGLDSIQRKPSYRLTGKKSFTEICLGMKSRDKSFSSEISLVLICRTKKRVVSELFLKSRSLWLTYHLMKLKQKGQLKQLYKCTQISDWEWRNALPLNMIIFKDTILDTIVFFLTIVHHQIFSDFNWFKLTTWHDSAYPRRGTISSK